jgi:amino acid permease
MQGRGVSVDRSVAVIAAALLVWPLTLPADPSALRYVAAAVPAALIITIGIVLWDCPDLHQAHQELGDDIVLWNPNLRNWLQAAAIMVNAFANIQNAVPTAHELERPTVQRIIKATVNGQCIIWLLLASLGIGGYLSWGSATKGDFLLNYPQGRPEIWTCRLMLAIIVYCVLPLATLPTAKSIAQLLLAAVGSRRQVSPTLHAVSATLVLALCTATALKVSDVASVIGVVGGLLASSLCFWFPAIIFRKLLWPIQPMIFRWPVLLVILFLGASCWVSVAMGFFE